MSETGTYQPDWLSQQKDWLKGDDKAIWEDSSSEFRLKLDNLLKPSDIDPSKVSKPETSKSLSMDLETRDARELTKTQTHVVWNLLRFSRPCLPDRLPRRQGSPEHCLSDELSRWYHLCCVRALPPNHSNNKSIINCQRSCHGGAIFPGIIDPSTGKSIISNRRVTGFTTKGEEEEGVLDTIKSWNRPTIEASAASAGATCELNRTELN